LPDHPKIQVDDAGSLMLNFGQYGGEIELACFSGDGRRLLTVKEVGLARIWDTQTREEIAEIRPSSDLTGTKFGVVDFDVFIEGAALDNTGEYALLGLNDGTAGVYRVDTGERLSIMRAPGTAAKTWELVRAVDFSADGSMTIVGFYNRCIGIWDRTGENFIAYLAVPDGDRCITGIDWGRQTLVSTVSISSDNRYAFAGFADMSCAAWEIDSKEMVFSAFQHAESVLAIKFAKDEILWATSGGAVWKCKRKESPASVFVADQNWQEVEFAPDNQSLLCRTATNSIYRWRLDGSHELLKDMEDSGWSVSARTLGFIANGGVYYVGGDSEVIIETDRAKVSVTRPTKIVHALINEETNHLLTEGWSETIEVWDIHSGKNVGNIITASSIQSIAISDDGRYLAVGTSGERTKSKMTEIEVWDLYRVERSFRWRAHHQPILSVAFGARSNRLISASVDGSVRLWQLGGFFSNEPKELSVLEPPNLDPNDLYVLKDGRVVICASGSYEVWSADLKTRLCAGNKEFGWHFKWAVDEIDQSIVVADYGQRLYRMSLSTEDNTELVEPSIPRPAFFPEVAVARAMRALAGAYLWQAPGGPYVHIGDGPRGWATPLRLSNDGKSVLIPCYDNARLVPVDDGDGNGAPEQIPFKGKFRAGRVTDTHIFAVNEKGEVFTGPRSAASPSS
jgi:WD40 repeat protein